MTTTKKTTTTRKKSTAATKKPATKKPATPQKVPDLPTNPFAYEVFDAVSKMRSKALKIEALQRYNDPSIRALLIWNFDPNVISQLPPGEVPYGNNKQDELSTGTLSDKINDAVDKMDEMGSNSLGSQDQGRTTIRKEFKMFYNFIKGGNNSLSGLRRETMFINILEGLHPLEAEILILVKDKKLGEKYKITQEVVAEAFPQINWGVNRST
tara:strand:- start:206 stop:838 length:633 start_codon:yes stop_codon:yes gene_type:complete